ncbi:tRNA (uracil(54)-C(5))-methyltransferase [Exophiala dermatitidis]
MQKLRMLSKTAKRQKFMPKKLASEGTPSEVLTFEAEALLRVGQQQSQAAAAAGPTVNGDADAAVKFTIPEPQTELELEIEELSSTGDGLAYSTHKNHVYVVPFSVPGDRVLAKTFPQKPNGLFTYLDFIKVLRPSPKRDGITPGCKYFGVCSGCQLQMMSYEEQLKHKKTIVEKAFKYFSNLDPSRIPPVGDTVGSPLQYGYRTKLTPHYDAPKKRGGKNKSNVDSNVLAPATPPPAIGFGIKGTRKVMDIESCPIGTPIINRGLRIERRKVHETFSQRKNGATILLRESTVRKPKPLMGADASEEKNSQQSEKNVSSNQNTTKSEQTQADSSSAISSSTSAINGISTPNNRNSNGNLPNYDAQSDTVDFTGLSTCITPHPSPLTLPLPQPLSIQHLTKEDGQPQIIYDYDKYQEIKTYTSNGSDWTTEHVGNFKFMSRANSFFQNNNSILETFIRYVRENCMPASGASSTSSGNARGASTSGNDNSLTSGSATASPLPIKYLLDAYCGSGLFAVCLSPLFSSVLGIDIDVQGVEAARRNAEANSIPNAGFIAADAECLFADVPFPPDQTLVVIDPPRKGASVDFLKQLCNFGPRRVVYVSCNVHTQARDVGMLVSGFDDNGKNEGGANEDGGVKGKGNWRYEIESLRGFDFFPQTGHVEGVCFLTRVEK